MLIRMEIRTAMDVKKSKNGSAMITVIPITLLSTLFSAALLMNASSHARVAGRQTNLEKAMFLAEAGAERAAEAIYAQSGYLGATTQATGSLGNGTFNYTITKTGWKNYTIESTGVVGSASRTVKIDRAYLPTYAEYALWMHENGEIYFIGGETFDGHVHANSKMWFSDVAVSAPLFTTYAALRTQPMVARSLIQRFTMGFTSTPHKATLLMLISIRRGTPYIA